MAFLVTIGLPIAQEEAFYKRAVVDPPEGEIGALYTRIAQMAEEAGRSQGAG